MRTSVLEFRLKGSLFCFNTKIVDYIFELEDFEHIDGLGEIVVGVTQYNDEAFLLVDTAMLYSSKPLSYETPKSVIVIHNEENLQYGMLVDEIVKIEDVSVATASVDLSSEEMVINHYQDKDEIINEIFPFALLQKANVSPFYPKKVHFEKSTGTFSDDHESYLLFKIAQRYFAIATKYLQEVLEKSEKIFYFPQRVRSIVGTMPLRDEVIGVAKLQEDYEGNDLVVVQNKQQTVALLVTEVVDIEFFPKSKLEKMMLDSQQYYDAFYNLDGKVVAILNPKELIPETQNKKEVSTDGSSQSLLQESIEYLVVKLAHKEFAIDMRCVRHVIETQELPKTDSSGIVPNENISFLTTWNGHAVSIVNLSKILGIDQFEELHSQTIFVESDDKIGAFMVSDVEDIYYLKESNIQLLASKESVVDGSIILQNRVVMTLNPHYITKLV